MGLMVKFINKLHLDSCRLEQEKIGTKRAQTGDKLSAAHGKHEFEGTMSGGTGITESRERWCVSSLSSCLPGG
jgi:hypothetical protein